MRCPKISRGTKRVGERGSLSGVLHHTVPPGAVLPINDDPTFPRAIQIYTVDPDTSLRLSRTFISLLFCGLSEMRLWWKSKLY
ncbi:hypothetical protein BDZ91DRAFT_732385 [Kalaharituber pfeilii]|nr:hypothetical protein BDZ91DRAFT_732385 [Kalaharituber pfeilii]